MTPEQIKQAVADGVREALSVDPNLHCRYQIDPDEHQKEHEALRRFMDFTARLENIKWTIFQKIILYVVMAAFGLMVYGGIMKLKIFGGLGWPGR